MCCELGSRPPALWRLTSPSRNYTSSEAVRHWPDTNVNWLQIFWRQKIYIHTCIHLKNNTDRAARQKPILDIEKNKSGYVFTNVLFLFCFLIRPHQCRQRCHRTSLLHTCSEQSCCFSFALNVISTEGRLTSPAGDVHPSQIIPAIKRLIVTI